MRVGKQELASLPINAIVAISVRCLRRVQSLFRPASDDPDRELLTGLVAVVIEVAERCVAGEDVSAVAAGASFSVGHAAADLAQCIEAATHGKPDDVLEHGATSIRSACGAPLPENTEEAARGFERMWQGIPGSSERMVRALEADYRQLQALALGSYPERGAEIDLSEQGPLGPLWPATSAAGA